MGIIDRSESRGGAQVIWLAVHDTEGGGTAQQLRDAAWWTGSSHAINDESGTLLTPAEGCVPYDRASWTLRGGNRFSENIEQVGWAHWSREEWLARPKLLDGTARWLADRSKARHIPLVKLSPADVAAGRPGVIGHVDYTLGTGDGTHTDPGPNYPWDVVMDKARAYAAGENEDEMNAAQQELLEKTFNLVSALPASVWDHEVKKGLKEPADTAQVLVDARLIARRAEAVALRVEGKLDALAARLDALGGPPPAA